MGDKQEALNNRKEDKDMAITYKPQVPLIIKPGMTKAFADALVSENRPKNYWEECASSKRSITDEVMEKMMKMCNGDD